MSTFEKVRDVICAELGSEPGDVELTSKLEDLGVDSMDRASLMLELENVLGIEIPEDDAMRLRRVYQIVDYVDSHS